MNEVLVEDAQVVKAGDILLKIDPRDHEVAAAQAEANVAGRATLQISRTNVPIVSTNTASNLETARANRVNADAGLVAAQRKLDAGQAAWKTAQAEVAEVQATLKKDEQDVGRYRLLVAKDEIAKQVYDTTVQAAAADEATVGARMASVNQARHHVAGEAAVDQAQTKILQANASIQSAMMRPQQVAQSQAAARAAAATVKQQQAAHEHVTLNLSYTIIPALCTGIVGNKTVEIGENVSAGQSLMSVVPLEDIWVTLPVRLDRDPGGDNDQLLWVGMSVEPQVYIDQ